MHRPAFHRPVLLAEAIDQLAAHPGGVYLDATLGEGGHAAAILGACSPSGRVLGIDLDPRSLAIAVGRLQEFGDRFTPVQGSYTGMASLAQASGFDQLDGVLMDLGFSARQVSEPGYGFSFQLDEALDMRFDPGAPLTAAEVVNTYSQEELARVIYQYGEEPRSRAIAGRIIRSRPVASTGALAEIVASAMGPRRGRRIHPATRTFQAIRIEVNDEMESLSRGLEAATQLLGPSGRLVVISYHSVEDRVVKGYLTRESSQCICPPGVFICVCGHQATLRLVHRRVIKPTPREVQDNPRSRSAKLRVAARL